MNLCVIFVNSLFTKIVSNGTEIAVPTSIVEKDNAVLSIIAAQKQLDQELHPLKAVFNFLDKYLVYLGYA